jgi:hypothetical protein
MGHGGDGGGGGRSSEIFDGGGFDEKICSSVDHGWDRELVHEHRFFQPRGPGKSMTSTASVIFLRAKPLYTTLVPRSSTSKIHALSLRASVFADKGEAD